MNKHIQNFISIACLNLFLLENCFSFGEDTRSVKSDTTIKLKRSISQFDLRLAEESIQEEKQEAHQQGYEEGIEKGRMEHLRQVVSKMMRMNQPDSIIAEVNELTIDQLETIKASLNQ